MVEYRYVCDASHIRGHAAPPAAKLLAAYILDNAYGLFGVTNMLGEEGSSAAADPLVQETWRKWSSSLVSFLSTPPGPQRVSLYLSSVPSDVAPVVQAIINDEVSTCVEMHVRLSELSVVESTMIRGVRGVSYKVVVDASMAPKHGGAITVLLSMGRNGLNIQPLHDVLQGSRVFIDAEKNDVLAFTSTIINKTSTVLDEETEEARGDLYRLILFSGGCIDAESGGAWDGGLAVLDGDALILPPLVKARAVMQLGGTRVGRLKSLITRRGGAWHARCPNDQDAGGRGGGGGGRCVRIPASLIEEMLDTDAKTLCGRLVPEELQEETIRYM